MGCKYVNDFEFGADKGFTGSAGQTIVKGYARGGKFQAKVGKVMGEYKEGTLHSGRSGQVVTNPKQAVAIAMSEARKATKKK